MPTPIGHSIVGLAINSFRKKKNVFHWKELLLVIFLVNLPDLDVVAGLLYNGNGLEFHRGPSHSIVVAIFLGYIIHRLSKRIKFIPRIHFVYSTFLIMSHDILDYFQDPFGSIIWPVSIYWSEKKADLAHIVVLALSPDKKEQLLIVLCAVIIFLNLYIKKKIRFKEIPKDIKRIVFHI